MQSIGPYWFGCDRNMCAQGCASTAQKSHVAGCLCSVELETTQARMEGIHRTVTACTVAMKTSALTVHACATSVSGSQPAQRRESCIVVRGNRRWHKQSTRDGCTCDEAVKTMRAQPIQWCNPSGAWSLRILSWCALHGCARKTRKKSG